MSKCVKCGKGERFTENWSKGKGLCLECYQEYFKNKHGTTPCEQCGEPVIRTKGKCHKCGKKRKSEQRVYLRTLNQPALEYVGNMPISETPKKEKSSSIYTSYKNTNIHRPYQGGSMSKK